MGDLEIDELGAGEPERLGRGLLGRGRECVEVASVLDDARRGRGRVLVVRGEPGVGKTALLEYAADLADGFLVLRVVGIGDESDLAFAGLHGLLRPVMDSLGQLVDIQARALAGALGLAPSTGADRFLVSAAVLGLLASVAEDRPVLCLVDDAQWLDRPSVDALMFAARRLRAERVAIVFGAREGDARRFEGPGLPELVLDGLDGPSAASLLAAHPREMSPRVRQRLLAEAAGNPLALHALPDGLTDAQLAGEEPLPEAVPLTPRLHNLFRRRISQLPLPAQTALLIAAAHNADDLATVLRGVAELQLPADALDAAENSALITTAGGAIRFRHPLVRAAVYGAAPSSQRRRVHAALAHALPGDEHADRRVWHQAMATMTGDEEVAVALEAAARRARQRGGHASAATAFQRAADLTLDDSHRVPRLASAAQAAWDGGEPDRARALIERALPAADRMRRVDLLHLRGVIESRRGNMRDGVRILVDAAAASTDSSCTLRILHDATDVAVDIGDRAAMREFGARAASLSTRSARDRFSKAIVVAYAALCDGEHQRARALFDDALSQSHGLHDPTAQIWAAHAASLGSDLGAGLPFATRAVELAREQGLLSMLPMALDQQAGELFRNSDFDLAYAAAEEGYQLSLDVGQGLGWHLMTMARVGTIHGHESEAREYAQQVIAGTQRSGETILRAAARATLGLLELSLGRSDHAADALLELTTSAQPDTLPNHALAPIPDAIEAAIRAGRPGALIEEPLARYRAWVLAAPTDTRRSLLARCEALTGHRAPDEAFGDALQLAHALSPFERARTELLFGEWLRRKRRRTAARPHLRAALQAFGALGAAPWENRAEAELRATGETARKRNPSTRDQLTPQELKVAELAATGLSNSDIAAQLFLSPRTIEYHLGKVFSKLGIASRTELIRHGPRRSDHI